uniref:Uncharacterized protein n=1 Tax=Glossina palpalis gambiensis TaxID=67801 RepID=A0A1B0BNM1_9MUSC
MLLAAVDSCGRFRATAMPMGTELSEKIQQKKPLKRRSIKQTNLSEKELREIFFSETSLSELGLSEVASSEATLGKVALSGVEFKWTSISGNGIR